MSAAGGLSLNTKETYRTFRHGEKCDAETRPFIVAEHPTKHKAYVYRPRCKLWSCPYCAEINRQEWVARAIYGAAKLHYAGNSISFLTITSSPKLDAKGTENVFSTAWDKLRRRATRAAGGGEYFLVPERHADGRIHAHALETFTMGKRWWKDNAAQCGLGFMADEQPARHVAAVAAYGVKYLSKEFAQAEWPAGWHRVRTSRGWPVPLEELKDPCWKYTVMQTETGAMKRLETLALCGYIVRVFTG